MKLVQSPLRQVDALILDIVTGEIPLIKSVANHIVASGGKRLRPVLTLLSAMASGYEGSRHIQLAAVVEFMHTATLLHDDVVDESKLRRGEATANEVWGNKASVLVGDFLLGQAFEQMVADGSLDVLAVLSHTAAIMSKGEILQLSCEGEVHTDEATYLQIIHAKTAALFSAACEIGPIIAGKESYRQPLKICGEAIGMAFQMVDDMLDYNASEALLGKTVGDDFREQKVTLPVIIAFSCANEQEKTFLAGTFTDDHNKPSEDGFQQACAIMEKYAVAVRVAEKVAAHCQTARESLDALPPTPAKEALLEIVEYSKGRLF